ncbi:MAG: hypothetical protein DWQ10_05015 [Calditrichaeota bacterium]|nr:MAG: hypothetical protein DWQ10_05015 [Calditrichota bacterium]
MTSYNLPLNSSSDSLAVKSGKAKTKSPRAALWRSILLPGWGQFYNEKYWKATFVLGLESLFIARAIDFNQMKQSSNGEDERNSYTRKRNDEVWRLLITRMLSVLDSYVDAHLYNFDESTDLSLHYLPGDARAAEHFELSVAVNW